MKNAETAEAAAHKTGCLKFFSKIGGISVIKFNFSKFPSIKADSFTDNV